MLRAWVIVFANDATKMYRETYFRERAGPLLRFQFVSLYCPSRRRSLDICNSDPTYPTSRTANIAPPVAKRGSLQVLRS